MQRSLSQLKSSELVAFVFNAPLQQTLPCAQVAYPEKNENQQDLQKLISSNSFQDHKNRQSQLPCFQRKNTPDARQYTTKTHTRPQKGFQSATQGQAPNGIKTCLKNASNCCLLGQKVDASGQRATHLNNLQGSNLLFISTENLSILSQTAIHLNTSYTIDAQTQTFPLQRSGWLSLQKFKGLVSSLPVPLQNAFKFSNSKLQQQLKQLLHQNDIVPVSNALKMLDTPSSVQKQYESKVLIFEIISSQINLFQNQSFAFENRCHQESEKAVINSRGNSHNILKSNKSYFSQSGEDMYQQGLDFDPEALRAINSSLRKSSLFSLAKYWNSSFLAFLRKLANHWSLYKASYENYLSDFIRLNEYKMIKIGATLTTQTHRVLANFYNLLYPHINSILVTFSSLLQLIPLQQISGPSQTKFQQYFQPQKKIDRKEKQGQRDLEEHLRVALIIEKESSSQQQLFQRIREFHLHLEGKRYITSNYVQGLSQMIRLAWLQEPGLKENQLLDLFARLKSSVRQTNETAAKKDLQDEKKILLSQDFLYHLQAQKLPETKCLGCTKFFYKHLNFYDGSVCTTPIRTFPSIKQIKVYETEIKDTICGMLNSIGGVILFDCQADSRGTIANGQFLTEKEKQDTEKRIGSYFQLFHPNIQVNKHVELTFVPMALCPQHFLKDDVKVSYIGEEGVLKQHQTYTERKYIKGFFVTRLKVRPIEGYQVYSWSKPEKSEHYWSQFLNGKVRNLKMKEVIKLIKTKFDEHYIPESYTYTQRLLMTRPFECFGHQCCKPETGKQALEPGVRAIMSQLQRSSLLDQKPAQEVDRRGIKKEIQSTRLEGIYPGMSLLLAHRNEFENVKQKLIQKDIKCQMEMRFVKYNLTPVKNTAVIYHKDQFQKLNDIITKEPKFKFSNGKSFMLIRIKNYLLIPRWTYQAPRKNQFTQLEKDLRQQFPQEKMRVLEQKKGSRVWMYYFMFETKLAALFMYFKLKHMKQEVRFQGPDLVQRAGVTGEEQVLAQLKTVYQTGQIRQELN